MNGIENSLKLNKLSLISDLSIADICFFCEFMQFTCLFQKPVISNKFCLILKKHKNYVKSYKLLEKLIKDKI